MVEKAQRASPLSVDDRRAMIIDAAIPLLIENGRSVTTRQIADEAGIAEGTIFRAFGDKESLIQAAIVRHLDPAPLERGLADISPDMPLADKVCRVIELMRDRFEQVIGFMSVLGEVGRPPVANRRIEFAETIARILEPDLVELNLPPERVAHYIRLISFASSIPQFNVGTEFDPPALTSLIMNGIAGQPSHATSEQQEIHAS
ncbi:helix-turn-helix domain-containing protein [Glaciihabitans sp. UYNi722]|uniref:TetR/AcrR family transcriptional regulator n=1 Tax=Glaciihabitans sp. UYNi722 TaxID=3156344 RepID=UPI0033948E2F